MQAHFTSIRVLRQTVCLVALAAVASLTGCIICPDGRPLGADAAAGFARLAGLEPHGNCRHGGCHGACDCGHGAACDVGEPIYAPTDCGPPCDDTGCPCDEAAFNNGAAPCGAKGSLRERIVDRCIHRNPLACVANLGVPLSVVGPPEMPPPGRFFPVPARPVFDPSLVYPSPIPSRF